MRQRGDVTEAVDHAVPQARSAAEAPALARRDDLALRLVAQLLALVDEGHREVDDGALDPDDGAVVLDLQVEGYRCLVVRTGGRSGCSLSPRELEIARMVALGYPNKTIASVLEISTWTVASHLRRVFTKLGVTSRAAMVARLGEVSGWPPTTHG